MGVAVEARKIGILGGTFDPIHYGHLRLADEAMRQLGLDEIIFIPDAVPPHKEAEGVTAFWHRYHMVEAAIAGHPAYCVSSLEAERAGKSYTYDTLILLHQKYPQSTLFFLTGADALEGLTTWHRWQDILDLCYFVVASRPGFRLELDGEVLRETRKRQRGIVLLMIEDLDISSTAIKAKIEAGESYERLLPAAVLAYSRENNLYRR